MKHAVTTDAPFLRLVKSSLSQFWQRFFLPNAHVTISNFRSFNYLGSGLFAGESKGSSPSPDSVMKLKLEGAHDSLSMLECD